VSRDQEPVGDTVILFGIPLPPSSNHQYATIMRGNIPIRVPSKESKNYSKVFWEWKLANNKSVNRARDSIVSWKSPLEVAMYVAISSEKMFTKDGRLKRWDVSNRCKSLHDLLAGILGVDDKDFVATPTEKILADVVTEQVVVVIRPKKVGKFSEFDFFKSFSGDKFKIESPVSE